MRKMDLRLLLIIGIGFALVREQAAAATLCVGAGATSRCYSRIQDAIDAANPGDTVVVKKGRYNENLIIAKPLTLAGESRDDAILFPAVSSPNPCPGDALCGGAASTIILVQADNVAIRNLTLDGDNPFLASGIIRGGADLDARNGIMTNHAAGTFNNLHVNQVSVRNIFLHGIAMSGGGTFQITGNTIRNVWGGENSAGIFNFGGSGVISSNNVENCREAIGSQRSGGVRVLGNEVVNSASGIHSDSAVASDLIQSNRVADGTAGARGIWIMEEYEPALVIGNEIENVDVGLAAFGQGGAAPAATAFIDNVVDGKLKSKSVGFYAATNRSGHGAGNLSVRFAGNILTRNAEGIRLESDSGFTIALEGTCNAIREGSAGLVTAGSGINRVSFQWSNLSGNGIGVNNLTRTTVEAGNNWWGCSNGPGAPGCDRILGLVDAGSVPGKPLREAPGPVVP